MECSERIVREAARKGVRQQLTLHKPREHEGQIVENGQVDIAQLVSIYKAALTGSLHACIQECSTRQRWATGGVAHALCKPAVAGCIPATGAVLDPVVARDTRTRTRTRIRTRICTHTARRLLHSDLVRRDSSHNQQGTPQLTHIMPRARLSP